MIDAESKVSHIDRSPALVHALRNFLVSFRDMCICISRQLWLAIEVEPFLDPSEVVGSVDVYVESDFPLKADSVF